MATDPLVSVVMPCFNAGRMLEPALWSAFAQTYPNLEIIFVDNNSTDGSAERARAFASGKPRPFRIVQCPEQGANRARNCGYAHARGDYIQWLDADDALGLQKVALQVAALERDHGAAIAYCDWMGSRHLPDGQRIDAVSVLNQVDDQILRTLSGFWYPPHGYLVRRAAADLLQSEQAWRPETALSDDVEYSAIAALLGLRFTYVAGAKVQYNTWSADQMTGSRISYVDRILAFQEIWRRLRNIACRPAVAARLTAAHRALVDQDWSVWAMPPGSVEIATLSAKRHTLRHVGSGHMIEVGEREATIATAMLAAGHGRPFLHHALIMAQAMPSLNNDCHAIVLALDRFRVEGLLRALQLTDVAGARAPEADWTSATPATAPSARRDGHVPPAAARSLPGGDTAAIVAEAWAEVLGSHGCSKQQRFDAAGGDSMALLNLALFCEARLGVPVPLDALSVRMRPADIERALNRILAGVTGVATDHAATEMALPTVFLIRVRHQMDLSEPVLRRACAGRANVVAIPLPAWPEFVSPGFDFSILLDRIVNTVETSKASGEVMLFGMCLGGFLAYLVAQRLAAKGRRIGFLGIVDADPAWPEAGLPDHFRDLRKATLEAPQFFGVAARAARFLGRYSFMLRLLSCSGLFKRLPVGFAARLNWHLDFDLPARFDRDGLARLMSDRGLLEAPTFVFRTIDQADGTPADLNWRRRCARVTVIPILGDHFSLFAPQHLPVALQAFSLAMQQALRAAAVSVPQSSGDADAALERQIA